MLYIRRRVGGVRDAWDEKDEYTRVERKEPLEDRDHPGYVKVWIEGKAFITRDEYVFPLVELEPVLLGDGTPLHEGGRYHARGGATMTLVKGDEWEVRYPGVDGHFTLRFDEVRLDVLRSA